MCKVLGVTESGYYKSIRNREQPQNANYDGQRYLITSTSFFARTRKTQITAKMTTDEVKSVIYRYIHYYNLRRIYTTNGGLPPMEKRRQYFAKTIAA